MLFLEVIYAFGVLFLVCDLGQRVQQTFIECGDIIYQLDWYKFPAEIQQMLPIIMNFSFEPIALECFGSLACVRETFKFVSESHSYSMTKSCAN